MQFEDENKELVLERFIHIMDATNTNQLDHTESRCFLASRCCDSPMRLYAIRWMMKVCRIASLSADTRDTSVQIFDKFLSTTVQENETMLANTEFISIAAACAVILSSKLHDSPSLRMSAFAHFTIEALIKFESHMLRSLNYLVVPLASPISFVCHLLAIGTINAAEKALLFDEANVIVESYWEGNESLLFSPAIIALAALVIAFSQLQLDCSEWLDSLPDSCFHCMSTSISPNILAYADDSNKNCDTVNAAPAGNDSTDGTHGSSVTNCPASALTLVLRTVDLCIGNMKQVPSLAARLHVVVESTTPQRSDDSPSDLSAISEDDADVVSASDSAHNNGAANESGRSGAPSPTGVADVLCENSLSAPATSDTEQGSSSRAAAADDDDGCVAVVVTKEGSDASSSSASAATSNYSNNRKRTQLCVGVQDHEGVEKSRRVKVEDDADGCASGAGLGVGSALRKKKASAAAPYHSQAGVA